MVTPTVICRIGKASTLKMVVKTLLSLETSSNQAAGRNGSQTDSGIEIDGVDTDWWY